jgi:hypothetical protein
VAVAHDDRDAGRQRARGLVGAASLAAGLGVGLGLAGCNEGATITLVIDVPVDDPDATASPLDEIALKVAHAGSDRDLVSQTFARGEALEVPGAPFGDDLVVHMSGFVGALNIAYGRTCAIAVSPNVDAPAPHLFFSRSVKFASLDVLPLPRIGGLGIAYLGTALFVGGNDGRTGRDGLVTDMERFDPLVGQLTVIGGVMPRDGAVHALVGTSPQRVVVLGGSSGSVGAKFIEVFDGRRIERLDFAEMARVDLTATSLTDGRVIVIGGNAPGQPVSGEIDEIAQNDASLDVRKLTAVLAHPRGGHSATRLGDDVGAPVLIAGGLDPAGLPTGVAELFKPLSEELANPTTFAPAMIVPRHGHSATLMPDGSVLFLGGLDALGRPVRKLELFSVDAGFVDVGDLPAGAGVVDFTATTLPDGRILITGGRAMPGAPPLDSAYIARLDPLDGSVDVVATDHLAMARADHQAVVLCDGTILVSGGTPGQFPAERYNPPPLGRR